MASVKHLFYNEKTKISLPQLSAVTFGYQRESCRSSVKIQGGLFATEFFLFYFFFKSS